MNKELNELILNNDFEKAYLFIKKFSSKKRFDMLISFASITNDIRIIGFAEYMLHKEETYENHELIANILNQMCWLEGAYELAYIHAKKMYEIRPCTESRLFLLFYWEIPEQPISDTFAVEILYEILNEAPKCISALNIYEKMKRKGLL